MKVKIDKKLYLKRIKEVEKKVKTFSRLGTLSTNFENASGGSEVLHQTRFRAALLINRNIINYLKFIFD